MFDSGVGGLSVLREIRRLLPAADLTYVADQAHMPYGDRSLDELCRLSVTVVDQLLALGATTIVIACNTASAAALTHVRDLYPDTQFVGMEPALKPACELSKTKVVGIIATRATFQGQLFQSLLQRHAKDVTVLQRVCDGLVESIERTELTSTATRAILERALCPLRDQGMDALVLGCTHFPFVRPLIEQVCGKAIQIVDPGPAVARQVLRTCSIADHDGGGQTMLISTGNQERFVAQAHALVGL